MRSFLLSCVLFVLAVTQGLATGVGTLVKDLDYQVFRFAQDPVRARIYATTANNSVIVIDTDAAVVTNEIFIGSQPRGLDVNADGSRLYVACSGATAIGVIDLTTLTALPSLPSPFKPLDLVAGLAGRLYVSFNDDDSLRQVSATDGTVQVTFGGFTGNGNTTLFGGGRLRLTPDRQTMIYGDLGYSPATLAKFDVSTATPALVQKSDFNKLGSNGEAVIMSHSGVNFCYATGSGQGGYGIALIPTSNLNLSLGIYQCDAYPANGSFNPDDTLFYTLPAAQQKVRIFNTSTFLEIGSFPTPDYDNNDIICDHTGRRLYVAGASFQGPAKTHVYALTDPTVLITSVSSATTHEGESFSFTLTSNRPGSTFGATGLPAGLNIDAASGVISGTPTQAGIFIVHVTATTPQNDLGEAQLTLNVQTPFTVAIDGQGAVTPGGAGTTWQTVGTVRELTATATSGNAFGGWTGGVTSANAHIFVTIQQDETVQANFVALVPFTVSVNGPGQVTAQYSGTTLEFPGATLTISAIPDSGARFIGWTGAVTSSQNPLQVVVAANAAVTANFELLPTAPLTVSTSGPGHVPVAYLGTTLRTIGSVLTIAATPNAGARFIGWTGSVTSTANPLVLNFTQAASLVANFESFTLYGGNYFSVAPPDVSGVHLISLRAAFGSTGAFTGRLDYGGVLYPISGVVVNLDGLDLSIPRPAPKLPLLLHLKLDLVNGIPTLLATLTDGAATFDLRGFRAAAFGGAQPAPAAGRYTFIIPPPPAAPGAPVLGHGNGVATIAANGAVTITGTLGDGTAFASGGAVLENNQIMLAVPLYADAGYLAGQLELRDQPGQSDFDGELSYSRPAHQGARYSSGFSVAVSMFGSRYVAPAAGTNLFSAQTGSVTLSDGNLPSALTVPIVFGPHNLVTAGHPSHGLQFKLQAATGLCTGSFLPPGGKPRRPFGGVIFQKTAEAVALHRGGSTAGSVILVPAP